MKNWDLNYQLAIDHSKNRISNKDIDSWSVNYPTEIKSAENTYKLNNTIHSLYTTVSLTPFDALEINGLAGLTSSKQQFDFSEMAKASSSWHKYTEDYSTKNSAIFAQLNLSLLDLYFFEIQGRNEKERSMVDRSAFNYSASAGISFKKFLKPSGVVSNATIRTNYGQIERLDEIFGYFASNNSKEKTGELNLELDFLSKHRLAVTLYKTISKNTPIQLRIPNGYSFNGPLVTRNEGEITYQGINVSTSSKLYTTVNSSFELIVSFNKNIAKLTKLIEGVEYISQGNHIYKEGEELPLLKYDIPMQHNGKTVYDSNGYPMNSNSSDLHYYNQSPDFTINIAPTYRYKYLSVSILCSWQKGGKIYSNTIYRGTVCGTLTETDNREELIAIDGYTYNSQTDTYTPYSTNISKEDYMVGKFYRDGRNSIVDASFFKIREASVSYLFDSPNKKYFQNISVSLVGRNLLLLAKQDHFDPETAFRGEENFAIPTTRSFSVQLTATF